MTRQESREIADRILDTTCDEEHPTGTWGPSESSIAQEICRTKAGEAAAAGEIDDTDEHRRDLAEALYREIFEEAQVLGTEVIG